MMLHIENVLSHEETAKCRHALEQAEWTDGRATAGHQSARVKHNTQIPESHTAAKEIGAVVAAKAFHHPMFVSAALPHRIFPPLFNRYEGGQHFGNHVDNSIRRSEITGEKIRTDLSATLFLTSPEEYEGGELVVEDTYGSHSAKLPAGDLILYPSSSLHHVNPVTRGARLCAFFWIQSIVRDDGQRNILFEMDRAIQQLSLDHPEHPSITRLTSTYHNLLRRWAEI